MSQPSGSDGQRERERERRNPDLQRRSDALPDRAEPVADQAPHHLCVDRSFPPDGGPELRIEDARRPGECLAREQLAPRRADPGREVVGLQQHGAGGAQIGVERVVPLFLALELLGRDVGCRRRLARFGRQLRQTLGGRGEPGREVGDRPLKRKRERIVLGSQGLQIGVGDVLVPERRFGGGERRAGLVEIERARVLRPGPPERHEDEGDDGPVNEAQGGRRLHLKAMMAPGLIRRRAPLSIRPWRGRGGNLRSTASAARSGGRGRRAHANTVFTLPGKRAARRWRLC